MVVRWLGTIQVSRSEATKFNSCETIENENEVSD